jgi:hypothetical protein
LGVEASPSPLEHESLDELPADLTALANILEAAMVSDALPPSPTSPGPGREPQHARPQPQPQRAAAAMSAPPREYIVDAHEPASRAGDASERETVAFEAVARSLAAAEACVPLLAHATGLLRIAALDVVRAETVRAGGLLQLLRFLRGDISPPMTAVSTAAVVQRLVQAIESEKRLRNIGLITRSNVADATCAGDETLLVNTLLTLLLITFAAVDGVQNGRVMLSVTVNDAGETGLAVSQDHVAAPAAWTERPLDHGAPDAAQAVDAIAINAAYRLARTWRGRFAVASGEHSSILTIWLPTLQVPELDQLPN